MEIYDKGFISKCTDMSYASQLKFLTFSTTIFNRPVILLDGILQPKHHNSLIACLHGKTTTFIYNSDIIDILEAGKLNSTNTIQAASHPNIRFTILTLSPVLHLSSIGDVVEVQLQLVESIPRNPEVFIDIKDLHNQFNIKSISSKEMFMCREINVEGTILHMFKEGWIDLECLDSSPTNTTTTVALHTNITSHTYCAQPLRLFLCHRQPAPIDASLRAGARLKMRAVLPVFLWGRLCGVVATVRSHLSIAQFAHTHTPALSPSTRSTHHVVPVPISVTKPIPMPVLRVPPDVRSRCVLYCAWRAVVSRDIHHAISTSSSSSSSSQSSSGNSVPVSVAAAAVLVPMTDRIHRVRTAIEKHTDMALFDISSGSGSGSGCGRTVQEEFIHNHFAPLFTVRAGRDADWLTSHLPKSYRVQVTALRDFFHYNNNYHDHRHSVPSSKEEDDDDGEEELDPCFSQLDIHPHILLCGTVIDMLMWERIAVITLRGDGGGDGDGSGGSGKNTRGHHSSFSSSDLSVVLLLDASVEDWMSVGVTDLTQTQRSLASRPEPGSVVVSIRNPCVLWEHCGCCFNPSETTINGLETVSVSFVRAMQTSSSTSSTTIDSNYMVFVRVKNVGDVICTSITTNRTHDHDVSEQNQSGQSRRTKPFIIAQTAGKFLTKEFTNEKYPACHIQNALPNLSHAVDSALHNDITVMTVRDVLRMNSEVQRAGGKAVCGRVLLEEVVGVVTGKKLFPRGSDRDRNKLDENILRSSACVEVGSKRPRPMTGDNSSSSRNSTTTRSRVCIALRDIEYSDVILVYAPFRLASAARIGCKVRLWAIQRCVSTSRKQHVYLEYLEGRSAIGISDIANTTELQSIIKGSHGDSCRTSNFTEQDTNCLLRPPPRTTVQQLLQSRTYNRCFWTLRGTVVAVKSVSVGARCTRCRSMLKRSSGVWDCSSDCPQRSKGKDGERGISFVRGGGSEAVWRASVAMDDGTGETIVFLDTERDVLGLFFPNTATMRMSPRKVRAFRDVVLIAVCQLGYVRNDHYGSATHNISISEDVTNNDDLGCEEYDARRHLQDSRQYWCWEGKRGGVTTTEDLIQMVFAEAITNLNRSVLYEYEGRIVFSKKEKWQDSTARESNQVVRTVAMQLIGGPTWQSNRMEVPIQCDDRLHLEGWNMREVQRTDVILSAYEMLSFCKGKLFPDSSNIT
eukprot:gene3664-7300_t